MAPTLGSAAGRLGVPVDWLRAAREAGAPGFAGSGRVVLCDLVPWLFAQMHKHTKGDVVEAQTLQEAKRLESIARTESVKIKSAERYGNLISRERHEALVRRSLEAGLRFIAELPSRFAATVNPAAPDVGARALSDVVEQVKARFRGEDGA